MRWGGPRFLRVSLIYHYCGFDHVCFSVKSLFAQILWI
jgi:hypothetical protein